MPYSAFRRSWMAENALLTALELTQSVDGKWLSGCAMRLWSRWADEGTRFPSPASAGGLRLAYGTWDYSRTTRVILRRGG
jgi:hypothetical protein